MPFRHLQAGVDTHAIDRLIWYDLVFSISDWTTAAFTKQPLMLASNLTLSTTRKAGILSVQATDAQRAVSDQKAVSAQNFDGHCIDGYQSSS